MSADADALLVREAQAGSRAAFDMLVLKYQRRVERLLARSVRDPADVADLSRDTFLAAYRALPAFRGESAFYTMALPHCDQRGAAPPRAAAA